nr:hypothetical protein [Methylobacterium sp. ZNC0032]
MSRALTNPQAGLSFTHMQGEPVCCITVPDVDEAPIRPGEEIKVWMTPKALLRLRVEIEATWRKLSEDERHAAKRALLLEAYGGEA